MKFCPTCKETYKDDELNFCLADGATLLKKKNGGPVKHSRANEIIAVSLVALAVLVFLCLVSYNPSDPTFNTVSSQKVQNWIGFLGANFAELLMSVMGITAYLLPALLAVIAWRVFQTPTLRPSLGRLVGYVLFLASVSGLIHLIGWHGGMVGALYARSAVYLLSNVGGAILIAATLIVATLLISNATFLGFFGNFEMAWSNFKVHYGEWKAKRNAARAEQAGNAKARMEKRRSAKEATAQSEPATLVVGDSSPIIQTSEINATAMAAGAGTATIAGAAPVTQRELRFPDELPTGVPSSDESASTPTTKDLESGEILIEELPTPGKYKLPKIEYLNMSEERVRQQTSELTAMSLLLAEKAKEFNVGGTVEGHSPGPVVTTYRFKPDPGVKYSRVIGLVDDLCLALEAESIRIDRIPGKAFVGIEVPNAVRQTIALRDVIDSKEFSGSQSKLTLALGKTIDGSNFVADLAKMPHLLIAGATGAGKSVGVNSLVVSILYKAKPDEVKFIMVDPKRLELGLYEDIPHLLHPIIVDPKKASTALKRMVVEMEQRYKKLAMLRVRNIDGYNVAVNTKNEQGELEENGGEPYRNLPYIVIIIDELADLMMVSGKDVEESITRLAQMARAVGIHLVLATQRPSVDVITGLIKANFPARISFRVSSKVDSRTIIDGNGAEGLLGKGDMLFLPPASSQVIRVHGAYVDEKEILKIVGHIKRWGDPEYDATITKTEEELDDSGELPGRGDPLFFDALKCVVNAKRASTSLLQRHLRIGYGRAAAILDAMVKEGYIGEMEGSTKARPVLPKAYEDLQDLNEMRQD